MRERIERQLEQRTAMLAGITGYGVAVLFLLHGAPDLALTQVLVETVSIVLFVLVLRRLQGRRFALFEDLFDTTRGVPVFSAR